MPNVPLDGVAGVRKLALAVTSNFKSIDNCTLGLYCCNVGGLQVTLAEIEALRRKE